MQPTSFFCAKASWRSRWRWTWRLGRRGWAGWKARTGGEGKHGYGGTVLTKNGMIVASFVFEDALRLDTRAAIDQLRNAGMCVEMLSGDTAKGCAEVADVLGVDDFVPCLLPSGKVERIESLARDGHKVLMVGDGADIGRNAADFVFLRESLLAIPLALDVSRKAGSLIRQNITIAIVYNAVAVPIAILGHVTPLIAAVAMSASSLLVIGNAMRLQGFATGASSETARQDRPARAGTLVRSS
nr:HAD-IC family P-type ATPase [Mesorhizobium sp. LSHC426A00]